MIIAFEGLDKAGKHTQSRLLYDHLIGLHRYNSVYKPFPRYDYVTHVLQEIDNNFSGNQLARLRQHVYAEDMHEFIDDYEIYGETVFIFDRWVHSTLAFGTATGVNATPYVQNLPKPDYVIYMHIDPDNPRVESDYSHDVLESAQQSYYSMFKTVETLVVNSLDTIERNHAKIVKYIEPKLQMEFSSPVV